MSSIFGKLFQISTWGESHGKGIGVVIDGCPPQISLSESDIQRELDRRRPGQSKITTQRREGDMCEILSGVFEGKTTGTPISIWVKNQDAHSADYSPMAELFRPSHADYTYAAKYGIRDWRGGGRASARETIGRVAAGAVAKKVLQKFYPKMECLGYVAQVKDIRALVDPNKVSSKEIESNIVRWPNRSEAKWVIQLIETAREMGDSVGGIIECVVRHAPAGLGSPVFDKLEADLAKAMLSIPATKGFEIGSGFDGVTLYGSEHNDAFEMRGKKVVTTTNLSGGVQGGISNGQNIVFRVAFKPTATIALPQKTISASSKNAILKAKGRHDPCVLPRAVPIVEAMTHLVLADHALRHRAQCSK
ncbi:MAG: chorismate synthase [Verrucomicrobiota bacterium]